MAPLLRLATEADAASLAVLAERTFRDTFADANDPDDLERHCAQSYGEALQLEELRDPSRTTVLSVDDGVLVGFLQLRWSSHTPSVTATAPVEIQRLYVSRDRLGTGIAQALMNEALRLARERQADRVWLGVWERNPRAIAFYGKYGFVEVGEHVFLLGRDPQRDLILARPA